MVWLLSNCQDEEVVIEACYALYFLSHYVPYEQRQIVMDAGACQALVALLM